MEVSGKGMGRSVSLPRAAYISVNMYPCVPREQCINNKGMGITWCVKWNKVDDVFFSEACRNWNRVRSLVSGVAVFTLCFEFALDRLVV